MWKEFKEFLFRGNVLDLAVAVIIGAAFTAVVTAFSQGILMQIIAGIFGKPDFNDLVWTVGDVVIKYGLFLTALVNFVIIAAALFLVIKSVNKVMRRKPAAAGPTEVQLLTEIRDLLGNRG